MSNKLIKPKKKGFKLNPFKLPSLPSRSIKPDSEHQNSLKDETNTEDQNNGTDAEKNDDFLTTENNEIQNKIQIQRNLDDLVAKDINQRTILHRAALEQNEDLVSDIIHDYEEIYKNTVNADRVMADLKTFINSKDKFGNTPLLNACSLKLDTDATDNQARLGCLKLLMDNQADVNQKNGRTFWNALFWIAYHGDNACMELLLKTPIELNYPDHQGFYPLDIAGKQVKIIFYRGNLLF